MKKFNFKTGKVCLNDFDFIEELEPTDQPKEKIWSFKQDIIQVKYEHGIVLDLGWMPEFNLEDGEFTLAVLKEYDWSDPIFFQKTKSIKTLYSYMEKAIDIAVMNETNEKGT